MSDKQGFVSIWVGLTPLEAFRGQDILAVVCGVPYYDEDYLEFQSEDGRTLLQDLLDGLSFAASFSSAANERAKELGLSHAFWVAALLDYEPDANETPVVGEAIYIGSFPYQVD